MKVIGYLILTISLAIILMPLGFVYAMFCAGRSKYIISICESIDRLGNVVCAKLFNRILITKEGYQFGDPREWVSSVIGKNKLAGTLSKCGQYWDGILNKVQKDHSVKNIQRFSVLLLVLFLSCNTSKPVSKTFGVQRTAVAALSMSQRMTNAERNIESLQSENDSLRLQIDSLKMGRVFLPSDKWDIDSAGNATMSSNQTIKVLHVTDSLIVGMRPRRDTTRPHDGDDTLIHDPGFKKNFLPYNFQLPLPGAPAGQNVKSSGIGGSGPTDLFKGRVSTPMIFGTKPKKKKKH